MIIVNGYKIPERGDTMNSPVGNYGDAIHDMMFDIATYNKTATLVNGLAFGGLSLSSQKNSLEGKGFFGLGNVQTVSTDVLTAITAPKVAVNYAAGSAQLILPNLSTIWNDTDKVGGEVLVMDAGVLVIPNTITINAYTGQTIVEATTGLTSVTISAPGDSLRFIPISSTVWKVV